MAISSPVPLKGAPSLRAGSCGVNGPCSSLGRQAPARPPDGRVPGARKLLVTRSGSASLGGRCRPDRGLLDGGQLQGLEPGALSVRSPAGECPLLCPPRQKPERHVSDGRSE